MFSPPINRQTILCWDEIVLEPRQRWVKTTLYRVSMKSASSSTGNWVNFQVDEFDWKKIFVQSEKSDKKFLCFHHQEFCKWPDEHFEEMDSTLVVQQYIQQLIRKDHTNVEFILTMPDGQDEGVWKYEHLRWVKLTKQTWKRYYN